MILRARLAQFQIAVMLLTRLPAGKVADAPPIAQTVWAYPLVGAIVGAFGGATLAAASALGLPSGISALLAVAVCILVTGGLHEDGLADLADGFGGGRDGARKLEIMRDSRIGSYGALALGLGVALRVMALAVLAEADRAPAILVGIEAASRAGLAVMLRVMPPARAGGLGQSAAGVSALHMIAALALGAGILVMCLGPMLAALMAVAIAFAQGALGWLAWRQVGGQTGDVLGAGQQFGVMAALLVMLVAV